MAGSKIKFPIWLNRRPHALFSEKPILRIPRIRLGIHYVVNGIGESFQLLAFSRQLLFLEAESYHSKSASPRCAHRPTFAH
jgi:hypothetical protein